jgi:hypothetical protein
VSILGAPDSAENMSFLIALRCFIVLPLIKIPKQIKATKPDVIRGVSRHP